MQSAGQSVQSVKGFDGGSPHGCQNLARILSEEGAHGMPGLPGCDDH